MSQTNATLTNFPKPGIRLVLDLEYLEYILKCFARFVHSEPYIRIVEQEY